MPILLILSGLLAAANWIALHQGWKRSEFVTKPLVMLGLLAWLGSSGGLGGGRLPFAVGLGLSLVGDVLLALPRPRFVAGLLAFLLAHLAYIAGLSTSLPPLDLASFILLGLLIYTGLVVYRRLAQGMVASQQTGLRWPVRVYMLVIGGMVYSALLALVRPEWGTWAALSAAGGGLLFLISDSLRAWETFVRPRPHGRVTVMVTYHLAQFLLALAAMIQFR
jgi:uncharacterized membrane protein YhhN